MLNKFPSYKQHDEMDCGPSCLKIISKYFGKDFSLEYLRQLCNTSRSGSSLLSISAAAEKLGFRTVGAKIEFEDMQTEDLFPCIAYWRQKHFIIVYKIKKNTVYVSDPAYGLISYPKEEFMKNWSTDGKTGIVMAIEPTADFFDIEEDEQKQPSKRGMKVLLKYLIPYKKLLFQVFLGLIAGSVLQLIIPFLTQSIVDIGIKQNDLNFINLILIAQLVLFIGRTSIEFMRAHILLHVSSRINIKLISDFFIKLMKLPLGFFDTKLTGDILQRIADHQRIETFITTGSLNTLFSCINILVFGGVLAYYNVMIFLVFLFGSALYFLWISVFMKKRAELDYKRFSTLSLNQEKNLELIYGMQEIKLHNAERKKRWQWEHVQIKLFKVNLKGLSLKQSQTAGSSLINELKNIFITFLSAKLVLQGEISLGMMLSISYINGQLNNPVSQLLDFFQSYQDAKISVARINEIHDKPDEEKNNPVYLAIPESGNVELKNISFSYDKDLRNDPILKDINLIIPRNKVTAIVGSSGSGKTTLLKLLLKFYEPDAGKIVIGANAISEISHHEWRNHIGSVMQEGYIFSDSIGNNIAVGDEVPDKIRLKECLKIANIDEFVAKLPLGVETKIGPNGYGLSTGQKQRLLIARSLYKNPSFLFFDEATSALDANNEKVIMKRLEKAFEGRTVLVIAHRLSTVKNADKIVVLEEGKIAEEGTHDELVIKQGLYYTLIKNQLELGA